MPSWSPSCLCRPCPSSLLQREARAPELNRNSYGGQSAASHNPHCCYCCYSPCRGMRADITLGSAGVDDEGLHAPERMADPPTELLMQLATSKGPRSGAREPPLFPRWGVAATVVAWTIAATCRADRLCTYLMSATLFSCSASGFCTPLLRRASNFFT